MSYGARTAKTSAQSPKKKSVPARKKTRSSVQKKSSPIKKNHHEQASSSTLTEPRQKRLSSLTAATLLQYCTSILSPARKLKSTPKKTIQKSTSPRKRQLSNVSENNKPELNIPTRTRREASSRASAMIMQQNEIERSRYSYSVANERSTSTLQRHRSKNTIPSKDEIPTESFKFNIPTIPPIPIPTPSIADISNQTECIQPPPNIVTTKSIHSLPTINPIYPSLTEALLAEHNRVQEKLTNKHDNLLKWTQELALCGRLSPPYPADEIPPESSTHINTKEITTLSIANPKPMNSHPTSTFLFPSSTYSLDLRSFYPLLPCWQYPSWPFQPTNYPIPSSSSTATIHSKTSVIPKKKPTLFNTIHKEKKKEEALTLHLHTHHHHHIHNSNSTTNVQPLAENNVQALNLSTNSKKTTRRKSSPVKRRINSGTKIHSSPTQSTNDKIPQRINTNENEKSPRRILKRRSVSAAAINSTTIVSITGKHSRRTRANSAINGKRSYSPASSVILPLSRKKQKVSHYWILFGKSEQKLVSIHADKPPVFRECYSSIRHTTEKDVIKSNDCVILRSDTGTRSTYLAKVKWFWKEPITDEIQMSLIWYYHPEHTELPLHIKNQFLPNELLASKYWDCISVECIEDKCYVLNFNEYNRYYLREKSVNLFDHSESVGQLKFLLNKNTSTIHHRLLPAKTVGNQNIFFCRYVYDYRVKRILKNPTFVTTASSV